MFRTTGDAKGINSNGNTFAFKWVNFWQSTLLIVLAMATILLISACNCSSKTTAGESDTVKVHYTLRLDDGTEVDSSVGGDPLKFTIGNGDVIPGFEQAVIGMKIGEKKTVTIPAEDAYGLYDDELIIDIERSEISGDTVPEVGMQLYSNGQYYPIIAVSDTTVTIDKNHKLAGEDLTFDIELVEIL